jgi:hypothetical protein
MLGFVLKRIWANTLLYLAILFTIPYANTLIPRTLIYALSAVLTAYFASSVINAIQIERKISSLGQHAPTVGSYAPYGFDTLARAVYAFSQWKNHEFWYWAFSFNKNEQNPWTVEDVTVGQRIIFTADEENIKAVLATKFQDFGKGEQFRKE